MSHYQVQNRGPPFRGPGFNRGQEFPFARHPPLPQAPPPADGSDYACAIVMIGVVSPKFVEDIRHEILRRIPKARIETEAVPGQQLGNAFYRYTKRGVRFCLVLDPSDERDRTISFRELTFSSGSRKEPQRAPIGDIMNVIMRTLESEPSRKWPVSTQHVGGALFDNPKNGQYAQGTGAGWAPRDDRWQGVSNHQDMRIRDTSRDGVRDERAGQKPVERNRSRGSDHAREPEREHRSRGEDRSRHRHSGSSREREKSRGRSEGESRRRGNSHERDAKRSKREDYAPGKSGFVERRDRAQYDVKYSRAHAERVAGEAQPASREAAQALAQAPPASRAAAPAMAPAQPAAPAPPMASAGPTVGPGHAVVGGGVAPPGASSSLAGALSGAGGDALVKSMLADPAMREMLRAELSRTLQLRQQQQLLQVQQQLQAISQMPQLPQLLMALQQLQGGQLFGQAGAASAGLGQTGLLSASLGQPGIGSSGPQPGMAPASTGLYAGSAAGLSSAAPNVGASDSQRESLVHSFEAQLLKKGYDAKQARSLAVEAVRGTPLDSGRQQAQEAAQPQGHGIQHLQQHLSSAQHGVLAGGTMDQRQVGFQVPQGQGYEDRRRPESGHEAQHSQGSAQGASSRFVQPSSVRYTQSGWDQRPTDSAQYGARRNHSRT